MIEGTVVARDSVFTGFTGSAWVVTMAVEVLIGAGGLLLNIVGIDLYEIERVFRLPVDARFIQQMRPRAPPSISHQPDFLM
jgi:hypothetical protein